MKKKLLVITVFIFTLIGAYNVYINEKQDFSTLAFKNIEALAQWEWPEHPSGGFGTVECIVEKYWDEENRKYGYKQTLKCEGFGFLKCEC